MVGILLLTALVGMSLGVFGSGGSIVMVPVLVHVGGMAPVEAVPLSLAVVGATSAVGAALYAKRGELQPKAALLFGISGVPGAWVGSKVTGLVPPPVLMVIFSALMLVVGGLMLVRPLANLRSPGRCYPPRCAVVGAIVGVLTGFLGVGGGFLLVPALVWFGGLDQRGAVGTSLAVILANSIGGLAGHVGITPFPWSWAAVLASIAATGMVVGRVAATAQKPTTLLRWFGAFVVAIGLVVGAFNVYSLLERS
jgi:uncharacterized membrane protein YfcA